MDFIEILKTKRYLFVGGLVTIFISLILPYYKVEVSTYIRDYGLSYPLIESWEGFVFILCIVACALLTFNKAIESKVKPIFVLIPIIIMLIVLIYDITYVNKYDYYKFSVGFYFQILGIAALIVHVFMYKGNGGILNFKSETNTNYQQPQQVYNQQPMMNQPVQPQQPMMSQQPMMNQQPVEPQVQPEQPVQQDAVQQEQPVMNQETVEQQSNINEQTNNE